MSPSDRLPSRYRVLATLALLLALNAAFVVWLAWAYGTLLPALTGWIAVALLGGSGAPNLLALPFSWLMLAVITAAFLLAQLRYGYARVLDAVWDGTASPEERPELHAMVGRLAAAADVPAPSVAVVDGAVPNCFTVGRMTDATIVVTTPLLEQLDRDELEAVLAHEIAHCTNRDVTLLTVAGLFIEVADRACRATRLLGRALRSGGRNLTGRSKLALQWLFPVVALSYVFVAPVAWLFPTVARHAHGLLAREREFAADRAAAELTGNPLALASALIGLHGAVSTPERDIRERAGDFVALGILPVGGLRSTEPAAQSHGIDAERNDSADRQRTVTNWLDDTPTTASSASTHPPVEERVRRLAALDSEVSR